MDTTRIRPAATTIATILTALGSVVAIAHPAHAATASTQGTGWKLSSNIWRLGYQNWTIQFYDSNSRTKLTTYAKQTAAQLKLRTGVTFTVSSTLNKPAGTCPTNRTIVMRIDSAVTRSHARPCSLDGWAAGGQVFFAANNWANSTIRKSKEIYKDQVMSHETGHIVGLAHPSKFTSGPTPLMRGEIWGGYMTLTSGYKFTPQDISGLKALRANASKTAPATATTKTVKVSTTVHEH